MEQVQGDQYPIAGVRGRHHREGGVSEWTAGSQRRSKRWELDCMWFDCIGCRPVCWRWSRPVTGSWFYCRLMSEPHAVCRNPKFLVASLCVWPVGVGMQACLVTVQRRNLLSVPCLFGLWGGIGPKSSWNHSPLHAGRQAEGAWTYSRFQPTQVRNYSPSTIRKQMIDLIY